MPKPHPPELRQRVLDTYMNDGGTYEDMARRFCVGVASVSRWLRLQRETGGVKPRRAEHPRSDRVIQGDVLEYMLHLVEDEPNWTTSELALTLNEAFELELDRRTVGAALRDAGLTFKRGSSGRQLPSEPMSWQRASPSENPSQTSTPPSSSSLMRQVYTPV